MLSLFGGRALHQQVSSKYSHTPGRSPQKVAADRPGGALNRVRSPYNRCALGTCERSDTPAATERRIRPATRNLKARATRLAWVQGIATILNDDDFPCYHCGCRYFLPLFPVDIHRATLYHSHCTPERSKMQAQRIDTDNLPKSFMMKSRICLATQGGGLARC